MLSDGGGRGDSQLRSVLADFEIFPDSKDYSAL